MSHRWRAAHCVIGASPSVPLSRCKNVLWRSCLLGQVTKMDVFLSVGLLVTAFLLPGAPSLGAKTFCDAPPVNVGGEASITCHFGEDLTTRSPDKVSFKVKRSDHNDTVYSRDVVLDCDYWYGTSPNCITIKPGYEYDNKVSDQLTVIIPIVTLQQAGKYICQVVGSDTSDLKACVLVVHNVSYIVNNTSQGLEEKKESQSSGSRNTAGTTPGAIVAAVLTAVVMVTVIIVIVVVILRRRGIICRSVQQKPPGKHTEGAASMYLSEDNIPEDVKDRAIQEIDRLVNFDFHGGSDGTLAREVWDIGRSKTNSYDLWQELEENGMRQFIDEGRAADIWGVISDAKRKPLQKDPKFR